MCVVSQVIPCSQNIFPDLGVMLPWFHSDGPSIVTKYYILRIVKRQSGIGAKGYSLSVRSRPYFKYIFFKRVYGKIVRASIPAHDNESMSVCANLRTFLYLGLRRTCISPDHRSTIMTIIKTRGLRSTDMKDHMPLGVLIRGSLVRSTDSNATG